MERKTNFPSREEPFKRFLVSGVPVQFPFEPYRAQHAVIYSVVKSIKNETHSLIESPTGTGKTMALLCASIATQNAMANVSPAQTTSCDNHERGKPRFHSLSERDCNYSLPLSVEMSNPLVLSDESDFATTTTKRFRSNTWPRGEERESAKTHNISDSRTEIPATAQRSFMYPPIESNAQRKPFRIYYCSRTHSQLSQVIDELNKTAYRPTATVLGSRNEYCVNKNVNMNFKGDINKMCLESVQSNSCSYYSNSHQIIKSMQTFPKCYQWDIEDLVDLGKDIHACPYYAIESLYNQADVVFCPYNYVFDPIIRKTKGISIQNDVVILDEGHNVESSAREAVSFTINIDKVISGISIVQRVIDDGKNLCSSSKTAFQAIKNLQLCLLSLVEEIISHESFKNEGSNEVAILKDSELMKVLSNCGMATCKIPYWRTALDIVFHYGDGKQQARLSKIIRFKPILSSYDGSEDESAAAASCDFEKISSLNPNAYNSNNILETIQHPDVTDSLNLLDRVLTTLQYLFQNSKDYIIFLKREANNFHSTTEFGFRCLNAAVCLREISHDARSVIITSGTISPMSSFATETGIWFDTLKELPHIVDLHNQLFVAVESISSSGILLEATFRESSKFSFQDAIGESVLDYCKIIPHGLLVFFPSYRSMDLLVNRWKSKGIIHQIGTLKGSLFFGSSSKGKNTSDFREIIEKYKEQSRGSKGAVLFDVCRGSFSEGIDFKDEMARGILMIGIPYSNINDPFIRSKMSWNDRTYKALQQYEYSGQNWYECQAYRAVNQALGRSLRHKYDYCSVILLDHRYSYPHVYSKLAFWIRKQLSLDSRTHDNIRRKVILFHNRFHSSSPV